MYGRGRSFLKCHSINTYCILHLPFRKMTIQRNSLRLKSLLHLQHFAIGLFLLFLSTGLYAQSPMQSGFEMLESGNFLGAKEFFSDYLQKDPDNKTGQLCYARATGLSGEPEESTELFEKMLEEYPEDLEIELNYAESWLWQKNYIGAKDQYTKLLAKYPENFVALLGGANTYSNLKEYETAKELINKALIVQPGNRGALTSKKYILLGLSADHRGNAEYNTADRYLSEILSYEPDDKITLLNKAINYILWDKVKMSVPIYEQLLTQNIDSIEGYLGLSYANLLLNRPKKSLDFAKKVSVMVDQQEVDQQVMVKAKIGEINGYGVVGDFKRAFGLLDKLEIDNSDDLNVNLARARLNLWSKNKEKAKSLYDDIYNDHDEVYDVNMNMVDLMRVYKMDEEAQGYLDKSSELIPNQPDVIRLKDDISRLNSTLINFEYHRGEDNGGNLSDNISFKVDFNSYNRFEPFVSFKSRSSYTSADSNNKLSIPRFLVGSSYQLNANTSLSAAMGMALNQANEITNGNKLNSTVALQTIVSKHHNFTLKYFTDFQDFTSGLVAENLSSHNMELDYYATTYKGLGVYSQFIYTTQNDDNNRVLFFISPYYDIHKVPNVKTGLNFLYFKYDVQRPTVYFSPSSFYSLEYFAATQNDGNRRAKILYRGFLAIGTQKIEQQENQSTIRLESELGYRFSPDFEIKGFYNYSNAAQSSATGFSYSTLGIRIKYYL